MKTKTPRVGRSIESMIRLIRGRRVILDADLARIYGVPTKRLNEQVKRNRARFPADFLFRLSVSEKREVVANCDHLARLRFAAARSYAFTEHGAVMAANVLNSRQAVRMSVYVVRAFLRLREMVVGTRELARRLEQLEQELKGRLDIHETAIVEILQRVLQVIAEPPAAPDLETPRRQIGFHTGMRPPDSEDGQAAKTGSRAVRRADRLAGR